MLAINKNPKEKVEQHQGTVAQTVHLLKELLGAKGRPGIGVRLWDGTCWPDENPRATTLVFKHPAALSNMLTAGTELGIAEAYLHDDFDIEGDIEAAVGLRDVVAEATGGWTSKLYIAYMLLKLSLSRQDGRSPAHLNGRRHTPRRDKAAVTYHYDVSNEFYRLWLDKRMVYSCGYFRTPEDDLDKAQERKLDHICRKLRLRTGQRLLDIGCGWGSLVMHAARHYGADATGITLSQPQADLANARIREAGLSSCACALVRDYREMAPDENDLYDAIASVGMVEHVGVSNYPHYFSQIRRLLAPGGAFLNHGITHRMDSPMGNGPTFINTYVFPDGELTPISTVLRAAEDANFEVRDVESLREHYAMTLRHWVRRLEARHEEALEWVDESTYRVWRLYMAGSAGGFAAGRLNVYQTLLAKQDGRGCIRLPLTREDLYN